MSLVREMKDAEIARRRFRWRARRGLLELDLRMAPLWSGDVTWTEEEYGVIEQLLGEQDPDLLQWFTGVSQPPVPAYSNIVNRCIAHIRATPKT